MPEGRYGRQHLSKCSVDRNVRLNFFTHKIQNLFILTCFGWFSSDSLQKLVDDVHEMAIAFILDAKGISKVSAPNRH